MNMDTKKLLNFLSQKFFVIIIMVVFGLIIALLIFKAGLLVGERKCGFSIRWNDNYHRNFVFQRPGIRPGLMMDNDLLAASGANGQIIKIDGNTIIVRGLNNVEKSVVVNDQTVIIRFRDAINVKDLSLGEEAVVIGEPNQSGQVVAKFIRVLPKKQ